MSNPTISSPLPDLMADMLNEAHAFFTANPAAALMTFELADKFVHVTLRDLHFIHEIDPTRFGRKTGKCAVCVAESESLYED